MKVLHINHSDTEGGAAIASLRLHKAMIDEGIDSYYLCYNQRIKDDKRIMTFPRKSFLFYALKNAIPNQIRKKRLSNKKGDFSFFDVGTDISSITDLNQYDVIYLHWINGSFINLNNLEKILRTGKPVFWFMHDMFPITAGCHHSFECNNYTEKCQSCLFLKQPGKNDFAAKQFLYKMRLYNKYSNLSFVAPSKWLCDCANKSTLSKNHKIYHIPNLLNPSIFRPIDKTIARNILHIPSEKKVILFGANGAITNPYKGFQYLADALQILSTDKNIDNDDILLLIFGASYNEEIAKLLPFSAHFAGTLYDEISISLLYNAADVFCTPSLAENFANTILEAVHCKTPIVGFDIGGIPDVVNDNTGYLAKYKNAEDFARGIKNVLFDSHNYDYSYLEQIKPSSIIKQHRQMWNDF